MDNDKTIQGKMETIKHIHRVRYFLYEMIKELDKRAREHDLSKLENPEAETFGEYTPELAKTEYGTPEYTALLEKVSPALENHYRKNRHHPEWFKFQEEWRPIVGLESFYEVSNYGQIRSVSREVNRPKMGNFIKDGKILKPYLTPTGYLRIQLQVDGKYQNKLVHRLVAETFIPNPQKKSFVNHLNSIRNDNYFLNLEWATASENLSHAYEEGNKISNAKYVFICESLGLVTIGSEKMEEELKKMGYENARSSAIYNCGIGESGSHLDLNFKAYPLEIFEDYSYLDRANLIDILEILCDWKAATERVENGDILKSIQFNQKRFNISPQLTKILENTAKDFLL